MNTALILKHLGYVPNVDFELSESGVVWWHSDPEPTQAEIDAAALPAAQAHKLAAIRAEAKQRIEARYPDWLQRNMTARSAELIDIRATVGSLTAEEEAERQGIKAIWTAIKSVRAASNAAEAQVTAADTVEAVEAVTVDWPTL